MGNIFSMCDSQIDSLIFYPPAGRTENDLKILEKPNSEYLTIEGVSIIMYKSQTPSNKYIVFSHGNACDIFSVCSYLYQLSIALNVNALGYDYYGYGLSKPGTVPDELGCYKSHETVINYLLTLGIQHSNIYLIGQSLGTGIAVDYVSKNWWWNTPIMLISPYKSIPRVVFDSSFTTLLNKFDSMNKLDDIRCPIKVLHGMKDQVIDVSHGYFMYNNCRNKALDPVWFEDCGHNDIIEQIMLEDYKELVNYFD